MSSFTGVSIVEGQEGSFCSTSAVDASSNNGFHLLMVNGYSCTKEHVPIGESINSGTFVIGGHVWYIEYYPNGQHSACADFISLYVSLFHEDDDEADKVVEAKFSFSLVEQVDKQMPMYVRGTETYSFSGHVHSFGSDRFMRRDALERSANLKGDCFTVRCDIMVVSKGPNTEDASGAGTEVVLSDIHQHFNILLQTKVGADVTFEVRGETFDAHRCVLAARSNVFKAQLFGPMKEGTTTSSVIQIKDMDAKVFRALLSFIYTDSFPDMEKDIVSMEDDEAEVEVVEQGQEEDEAVEDEMRLQWLQDLFAAADKYDLQRLKFICERQLFENIGCSSVMSTLALAEQHLYQGLKEACLKFIQFQSPSCLQTLMTTNGWDHVYMTYPSVFKELIAKLASNQRK